MKDIGPALVRSAEDVSENILAFSAAVASSTELQSRLGRVRAWYAVRTEDGWAFGPSKFVGYRGNSARQYIQTSTIDGGAHGGTTERELRRWFGIVSSASALGQELTIALTRFLLPWGRTPRAGVRINVLWSELNRGSSDGRTEATAHLSERISVDPQVAGGRPCIRGTRMRVSDIVDMLAAGASKGEVLADYPYLTAEDIAAALAYAARATDHRVIVAA
ncbi:MAG TPA: DUF433 domain-containing protein [Bauldia sp.]|nr:DUF433 domain-containing protein [Bauldia sp.]